MSQLKITLVRGTAGKTQRQKTNLKALGLRKQRQFVLREDTPSIRGIIGKVSHLVTVETVEG